MGERRKGEGGRRKENVNVKVKPEGEAERRWAESRRVRGGEMRVE